MRELRSHSQHPQAVARPGRTTSQRTSHASATRRHWCGGRRRVRRARAGFEIDHSEPQARVWRSRGRPGTTAPGTPAEPQATSSTANSGCAAGEEGAGGSGGCKRAWLRCPWAVARPGQTTSRRAEPHISDQAPPVRRAPEGPEGTGGLRDRHFRAFRLACGDLAGGRTRRRPEHQRSRKQQAQSLIPAAPPARTARGRAAAHGRTKQPGPTAGSDGAQNTSGATSTTERRSLRTPRSTPGSGRPGGRRGGPAR